ncbi:TetR/AcrR family transcriptional regulator [Neobacillus niacini]|uniref:TetR/AcrR family transcriptional regulator n=1 Tax=Neobacillus niacini TaxID=86668 RepID=UPI0021CB6AF3|nr:TetR family transcriptional regulator [Neobacillus niacini]MCM3767614.1 TetR family transcriptional regulator [Neobacillus niacini]
MAPKSKFNKDQIIEAAFEIARTEGIGGITIRKVADKLGSSIAPIYVNFKDVDELIQEVVNKTFEVNRQLIKEQNTGYPFRDIGAASLKFAKEYSALFRDLVMKQNDYINNLEQDEDMLVEMMKQDPTLESFSNDELRTILLKMRIFQIGLSLMVANELLPDDFNEEKMMHMLGSTASDIITAAQIRKGKNTGITGGTK